MSAAERKRAANERAAAAYKRMEEALDKAARAETHAWRITYLREAETHWDAWEAQKRAAARLAAQGA